MSARYQAREMTDIGWGDQFYAERLNTVRRICAELGGQWRVRRQWKWGDGRWHMDHGKDAERWLP